MKRIIVITSLFLMSCNGRERDMGRYCINQNYKMVNGTVTMETQVVTWDYQAWAGDIVYDNRITISKDSIVYYKQAEHEKAEAYRDEWFQLNRPGIEPRNVARD